ncbi:hypothetical protein HPB52_020175 [Rhipicephalus sanguineus]|uniref:Uncharacterized protein n=1 Tax=Rhipicephalus sanguineus TaxID=34632 RepID=A0A9D4PSH0_RHISA|nr:hypothetical protein HPB52_020175 [Rhipicephalus sanguineus]
MYPKHEKVEYAVFDRKNNFGAGLIGPKTRMVIKAYRTLNNTLIERRAEDNTDSLLLDRRVDVILGARNVHCWSQCFFYPYALYSPNSGPHPRQACRPRGTIRRLFPSEASSLSGVTAFVVSTYIGRSPPPEVSSVAMSSKIMMATWMVGMLFLINFIQTEITSSRTVPEYSSEIRSTDEFVSRVQSGTTRLCVNIETGDMIRRATNATATIRYLNSLN